MKLPRCNATPAFGKPTSLWAPKHSAGVVEDDLPAVRAFAPNQREDSVVLLRFAFGSAFQVELAGHERDLRFATSRGKQSNRQIVEAQLSHLLRVGIAQHVPFAD